MNGPAATTHLGEPSRAARASHLMNGRAPTTHLGEPSHREWFDPSALQPGMYFEVARVLVIGDSTEMVFRHFWRVTPTSEVYVLELRLMFHDAHIHPSFLVPGMMVDLDFVFDMSGATHMVFRRVWRQGPVGEVTVVAFCMIYLDAHLLERMPN